MKFTKDDKLAVLEIVSGLIKSSKYWDLYGITLQSQVADIYSVALSIHFKTDHPDTKAFLSEVLR